jgi:hypothetical protein
MSLRYITRKFSLLLFGICVFSFSCAGVNAIHTVYAADKDKGEKDKDESGKDKDKKDKDEKDKKDKDENGKDKDEKDKGEKDKDENGKDESGNTKNKSEEESGGGDRDGLIDVDPKQEDFDLPDADASQKNLSTGIDSFMTMLSVILRAAGAILGAYATGKLIMAFHNDNADAKNNAVIMLSMAIIMIIMPSIVDALDIKSFFQK